MTPETTLLDLALHCEQAVQGSKELDAAIAACQGLIAVNEGHPLGWQCYDADGRTVAFPRYTASLDAAMMLVPENWRLDSLAEWVGLVMREKGPWRVALTGLTPSRCRVEVEHAATPALALCATALRARASQVQGGED